MEAGRFRFDQFLLDPRDRQLTRDGEPVEINGRYLDALTLLVREQGRLVTKDQFLEAVWRGVPVTDEALTQCIKTLRRQLGDSAARPRFIETVPKHGYRFIAAVQAEEPPAAKRLPEAVADSTTQPSPLPTPVSSGSWRRLLVLGGAGTAGGGVAGMLGGLFYGFGGASSPEAGMGSLSVVLVFICLTMIIGLIGGAGVAFGVAAGALVSDRSWQWSIAGGAVGGMVVGAVVKLVAVDAFNLLVGRSPGDITGAPEGALLGAAVGFGAWLGKLAEPLQLRRSMAAAGLASGGSGLLIALLGGRLMGGSLDLLSRVFTASRLRLDQIAALVGEGQFGQRSLIVTSALEGLLFGAFVVGAMILARRRLGGKGFSSSD